MPEIVCVGCGNGHIIVHQGYIWGSGRSHGGVIRGVLTCRRPIDYQPKECGIQTIFELTENAITFYPGKDNLIELNMNAPDGAKEMYEQARLCIFGTAYRAAAVMGRASLEQALIARNFTSGLLEEKIDSAKANGTIGNREFSMAHGSRLIGNDAIHKDKVVTPAYLQNALSSAATIVNHLFP